MVSLSFRNALSSVGAVRDQNERESVRMHCKFYVSFPVQLLNVYVCLILCFTLITNNVNISHSCIVHREIEHDGDNEI